MAISGEFSHEKWWCSILILVYYRNPVDEVLCGELPGIVVVSEFTSATGLYKKKLPSCKWGALSHLVNWNEHLRTMPGCSLSEDYQWLDICSLGYLRHYKEHVDAPIPSKQPWPKYPCPLNGKNMLFSHPLKLQWRLHNIQHNSLFNGHVNA